MYSIINLSLNELIMCIAIEIHSKLPFLLIMNRKTKFDLINPANTIKKMQRLYFSPLLEIYCD